MQLRVSDVKKDLRTIRKINKHVHKLWMHRDKVKYDENAHTIIVQLFENRYDLSTPRYELRIHNVSKTFIDDRDKASTLQAQLSMNSIHVGDHETSGLYCQW